MYSGTEAEDCGMYSSTETEGSGMYSGTEREGSGMHSSTEAEGSGTEMGKEVSESISEPQWDRPTQGLDGDRPGFTTRETMVKSDTLPDPMIKQSKVKQRFTNQERIDTRSANRLLFSRRQQGPTKE